MADSWKYSTPDYRAAVRNGGIAFSDDLLDHIVQSFYAWANSPVRSMLYNTGDGRVLSVQDVRRGNSKWAWRIRGKVSAVAEAMRQFPLDDSIPGRDPRLYRSSRGIFATLEFPPGSCTSSRSWLISSGAMINFKSNVERLFRCRIKDDFTYSSQTVKEAHDSGYCHIHWIMVFDDGIPMKLKASRRKGAETGDYFWRISDYNLVFSLKTLWSRAVYREIRKASGIDPGRAPSVDRDFAFSDFQGIVSGDITDGGRRMNVLEYLLKYLTKASRQSDRKQLLTLALGKMYGTRFQFSKSFLMRLGMFEPIRHDILTNELKQLKNEYLKEFDKMGDLYYRGCRAERMAEYGWWLRLGIIAFEHVQERRIGHHDYEWYERLRPPEALLEEKNRGSKPWAYLFHVRFDSAEDAKAVDVAVRAMKPAASGTVVTRETVIDRLRNHLTDRGLSDKSDDFFQIYG